MITASGQPVANFTATPLSGCAPLIVQFTDNSAGNPVTWNWDFGNGTSATQKNPVITYTSPGVYSVKLTVSSSTGTNSITKNQYITVYDKPNVNFTAEDSSNCIPFTTKFIDLSTTAVGNITSWQWDFDDGNTSTLQNPAHLYSQAGNFNITLQVTNSGGCSSSLSKLAYIKAADSIRTQFNFSQPVKCKPPETISFYNNTIGPGLLTYKWNFGDGSTTNTFSPTHAYNTGGLYTITLIARNNLGCADTFSLKDTLLIKNVHSAIISDDTVCVNYRMPFANGTTPVPLSSQWIYSDGTSSFGATTAKAWITPGNHTVKLISNFNSCSDSVTKNIRVLPTPVINFSASDPAACRAPLTVNFNDLSTGAANWLWNFGDGGTSSIKNPTHTFNNDGEYHITLTVNSAAGCTASLTQFRFIRIQKPKISIDLKDDGGCIPYSFSPYPSIDAPDGISSYLWDFGNGHTSTLPYPTEIYTDSGTYDIKLIATSIDGCIDSLVIPAGVRTGNRPHIDFSLSPTVVCPGAAVQFTDLSSPADKWLWKFNDGLPSEDQNPVHKFSDSGKYSIKLIVWNNGCNDSVTKFNVLTVLPGLARFRPIYNCNNKKEVFFKDSSILPQSWNWNFGDGGTSSIQNPVHTFSNYQTYTVSLTTTNGACTNTNWEQVKLINEVPDFVATKTSFCKPDSVVFYMQNFNKANIASYVWDFGDGIKDSTSGDSVHHIYNNAGRFSIQLTAIDSNGCSQSTVKTNYITVSSPRAGFALSSLGGCRNKTVNFTDTSANQSGIINIAKWIWDFGDGQVQSFTAPLNNPVTHVYTTTGYYYPSLKIIDSIGCADSVSYPVPLRIYQPVANFFAPNFNTCISDTLIIRNPSTGTGLSYNWSFGDGSFSTDSLPIKKYLSNGDFTIKLAVADIAGCTDSMIKTNYVKVRDVTASFTVNDSIGICTPFTIKFTNTSTNSLSHLWDFGDGGFSSTTNPVYSYVNPGVYFAKLTAKRSTHCFKTDSLRVTIKGPSAILQYAPLSGCSPLNTAFTVVSHDSLFYSWDFNDGNVFSSGDSAIVHNYTKPGAFLPSVVVKDTSGCILQLTGTDTVKIFSSKVNFAAADTAICSGDSIYLYDSTFAGSTITNYRWEFGDGTISPNQHPVHFYNSPGTYTIKLFVNTIYGCTDSLIKPGYIKVFTTPQISITGNNATYCGQSNITFTGNATTTDTSAANWSWNFGNGQTSLLQNPAIQQYNDTGLYNIQLVMHYGPGCADTVSTSLRILPVPATEASKDTAICAGSTALLHASGADTYTWQPASYLSCTNCNNPVSNSNNTILYYVSGTNTFGCEKTDSVVVTVKKPFTLTGYNDAAICSGKNAQLSVNGGENYTWSPSTGLNNTNTANPVAAPNISTTYTVVGTDSINCFSDTASVYVEVYTTPSVNAGPDIILNAGKEITLSPQYSNDIVQWLWQPPAGLSCTNCPSPVANPSDGITYTIKVTNSKGCTATDNIFIQLKCDRSNIYMPTAFSPNGDGNNENFCPLTPPGTGTIKIIAFKIYNRLGQLVFINGNFNTNDHSKGWNGEYKGVDAPAGTYVYTVDFICSSSKVVSFSGNILLLR